MSAGLRKVAWNIGDKVDQVFRQKKHYCGIRPMARFLYELRYVLRLLVVVPSHLKDS